MKMKVARFGILLTAVLALVAVMLPAYAQPAPALKKLHWDVSLFGPPRQLTFPINDWAKAMGVATNHACLGWRIDLHECKLKEVG